MNIKQLNHILFIFFIWLPFTFVAGQQGKNPNNLSQSDSLTLSQVLQSVMQNHPSIKQAEEALNAADAKIGLAKANYLPEVDFNASWSHLYPDFSLGFGSLGTFYLFSRNNYNATLNVNQTIYDFGNTSNGIKVENENKTIADKSIDLVKQQLTMKTISTYYMLVYYQQAILIKDEELKTLQEHLVYVEKKQVTGSATRYEILSTKVRISNTENQKQDLLTYQDIQRTVLNTLTGTLIQKDQPLKQELKVDLPFLSADSLLNYAFDHRVEMAIAKEKETQAQLNFNVVKTQNAPVLSAFASGGYKNGFLANFNPWALYDPYLNYVVGVGLKVPIFDSNRHKYNMDQARSNISSVGFDSDIAKLNVTNEVTEANVNCISAKKKIEQYNLQLAQAEEAYQLAQVNFNSGAITNLDLLDSETAVSESQLLLLKSRIDYIVYSYNLKIALGNRI